MYKTINKFFFSLAFALSCGSNMIAQTVPDAGEFLPGPPEETTVEYIKDYLQYAWGKTMRGTELGQQAQSDFNAKAPYYLNGRWLEPSELGGPAVFLASKASDAVNGHILYVDGGILAYIGKQPK